MKAWVSSSKLAKAYPEGRWATLLAWRFWRPTAECARFRGFTVHGTFAAKAMGLRVVGIDSTAKAELVKTCGVEHFIDFSAVENVVSEVIRLTGGGAHLSIICVAHPSGYSDALLYARTLGKIACVGLAPFGAQLIGKQLTLIGTQTGSPAEAAEALSFVERGLVRCELEKRSLHDIERTLDDLKKGKISGRVVIDL
ncbi:SPOSA6832_03130 [Sporobolomyces salmonicolor]|uniref:SPOSA6832_03130-mRNA-1:cds n=1 Tax=Sporidiobolus salmonicolor TaxID=5005 RepID=A0A0D6EP87_SPOSA|nr:SPOSA6832_03130 [Sporobolomyces salmonicolor]